MTKLPRYTQSRKDSCGFVTYRFNPPQYIVDAGVVERVTLGTDFEVARKQIRELNKKIDVWRKAQAEVVKLNGSSTVRDLCDAYYQSNDFNMLRDSTKVDYKYFLAVLCEEMGDKKFHAVRSKAAKAAYEVWVKRGVSFANHVCTVASRLFNFAIQMEHGIVNPFSNIKRKQTEQRKVVWRHEDVVSFLNTAYTSFDTRSIGLIVQMAYEWCQRLGDMRMLTWDNIDFDKQQLYLKQSKRRAEVFLPISDDLIAMLKQQYADFNFQSYVAPHPKPTGGSFVPYAMETLSKAGRAVMRKAGLSESLRLMDLRRTGVTQMVEAGVPLPQVMSVTGHTHVSSVQPYMKHTYRSANSALTARQGHVESNAVSYLHRK